MKKVLFLLDSLNGGGAEKSLYDLCCFLVRDSFDLTVMTVYDQGIYKNKLPLGIKYHSMNLKSIPGINYLFRFTSGKFLYRKFIKDNYDVEIAYMEGLPTKIVGNLRKCECRKIAWVRTDLTVNQKSLTCFRNSKEMKDSYEAFDEIAFVGIDSLNAFAKLTGLSKKLSVKQNITNVDEIFRKSLEPQNIISKGNHPLLLSVGRLRVVKGFERLIESVYRLKQEGILVDLWLLGDGSEKSNLRNLCNQLEVSQQIYFLGFQENPYKFMKEADIFVSSSLAEGYSTVVKEAAILGKVVVATDCAGTKEILGDSEYGIVCDNSTDALCQALKEIIISKELYENFQLKVKQVKDRYSLEAQLLEIKNLING